jgi:hypothetical protein
MMLRILDGLTGGRDIDFDDSPLFSKKYLLTANNLDHARQLFSKTVRDHFETNLGLQVIAAGNKLLMFRPNQLCKPEELDTFVQLAMETVDLIQQNAVSINVADSNSKKSSPTSKAEALEQLQHHGGIAGAMIRHQIKTTMLDQSDLDRFLAQPVPRTIPPELKKRFGVDLMLIMVPVGFSIGGIVFFFVGSLADVEQQDRLISFSLASLLILVGALILYLVWYFRNKKMRVLKHGKLIEGTVKSVTDSGWVIGNEPVWEAKFVPVGQSKAVSTYFRGCNLERAKELVESGETTQLLVDPRNDQNSLLMACYAIG